LLQEERFREERTFTSGTTNLSSGTTGHTHIDTFERDAYGNQVTKPGIGTKLKNVFKKFTHKNKEEEDYEGTTYGPNGERISESYHREEKF